MSKVDEFLQRVEARLNSQNPETAFVVCDMDYIEKLVKLVRMLSEACSYYGEKKNWGESDPDMRNWYPIESRDRGDKARHALKECGEIVNE